MPLSGSKRTIAAWCVGRSTLPGKSVTSLQPSPAEAGRRASCRATRDLDDRGDARRHRDEAGGEVACASASASISASRSSSSSTSVRVSTSIDEDVSRRRDPRAHQRRCCCAATGAFGTGCCGGFESTSTAAASSTAIATALSPSRLRESRATTESLSMRGAARKWCTAPQVSASATSESLTSSTWPYPVVQRSCDVRQAEHAEIGPCGEQERDEHGGDAREAEEDDAPEHGCPRPDDRDELHEASDPERRGGEVHPVGELREPRVAGVGGRVAREGEPGGEAEPEREHRPEERAATGQPREEEQCRHQREAELHHDERPAEARPARDRRQVAVEEAPERQLERVLRAEQERDDPDLEHRDRAGSGDPVEPPLRAQGQLAGNDEQAEADAADEQREGEEVQPPHDVLRRRRPLRAHRVGDERRRNADAEGVDARDDVPVVRESLPPDRVRPARETSHGRHERVLRRVHARREREVPAVEREHDHGVRQELHRLVEAQHDRVRRPLDALPVRRRLADEARMRERSRRKHEHGERADCECAAHHRCGAPANCDRCPSTGATSRSQNSITAVTRIVVAKPVAPRPSAGAASARAGRRRR